MKSSRPISFTLILFLVTTLNARAGIYTWDGGSFFNSSFEDGDNWDHNVAPPSNLLTTSLVFAGQVRPNPVNITAYSVHDITFDPSPVQFLISGEPLSIGTGG